MHLLTEEEAAKALLITKRRLQELCREAQIGFVQISPRVRGFTSEQVDEYVQRKMVGPKAGGPKSGVAVGANAVDKAKASRLSSRGRSVTMKGGSRREREKLTTVKDSGASLSTKEIRALCQ